VQKLLAFVDFSDATSAVLTAAIEIARAFQMKLIILHVATPDDPYECGKFREDTSPRSVASEMRRFHRALQIMSLESIKLGVDAQPLLVRGTAPFGNPVPKLLGELLRRKPALIVMGAYGHSRLHEALLGSASAAVLRKAICPVLLIPSRATKPVWPECSDERRLPRTKVASTKPLPPTGKQKTRPLPRSSR
jgi:nucleotide-binding universal stress UspA family protein